MRVDLGGGEPDNVLALRIDVVAAAVAWKKTFRRALDSSQAMAAHDECEEVLYRAVSRYNVAVKKRRGNGASLQNNVGGES